MDEEQLETITVVTVVSSVILPPIVGAAMYHHGGYNFADTLSVMVGLVFTIMILPLIYVTFKSASKQSNGQDGKETAAIEGLKDWYATDKITLPEFEERVEVHIKDE